MADNYNSLYTGPEIDASVGKVLTTQDTWDAAAAAVLPAGGTEGQLLVKTGAADYATGWTTPTYARPNLLDNWYFGPGVINQRIRTSGAVSGSMFAVDRWRGYYANGFSFEILSDCVRFTTSGTLNRWVLQTPRSGETYFPAGDYTLSVLIKNLSVGEDQYATLMMMSAFFGTAVTRCLTRIYTAGLATFSFTLDANKAKAVSLTIPKKPDSDSADNYADVVAFKLEKGDTQTLAHQENGAWVLNEIPEPETERLKCQRFFQIFSAESLIPKVGNTAYGMDFRPPMVTDTVTTGDLQVDGVTYYTASSEPSLS